MTACDADHLSVGQVLGIGFLALCATLLTVSLMGLLMVLLMPRAMQMVAQVMA